MSVLDDLRAKRRQTHIQATALANGAAEQNRYFTESEQRSFETLTAQIDELDSRIGEVAGGERQGASADAAFRRLSGGGMAAVRDPELDAQFRDAVLRRSPEPIEVSWPSPESGVQLRDLASSGMLGTSMYGRILASLTDNAAVLKAGATMISSTTGEPLAVPRSTARSAASIVAEGATIPESDPSLGTVTLTPYKYAFLVSVTDELVNDNGFDLSGYLARQAGQALANGAGAHFVTGTGSGQPFGVLTEAVAGVTGAAPAPTADELIDLQHSIASPYESTGSTAWLMNRTTLGLVRKLQDGSGRYVFLSGNLLGHRVLVDPSMPDTATGAASVLFGDFSRYWVRQVNGVSFEASRDFHWDTDVTTFRAIWRATGATVDVTGALKSFVGG